MSVKEIAVLSEHTRTNLATLKRRMKELGFIYSELDGNWISFGVSKCITSTDNFIDPSNQINLSINYVNVTYDFDQTALLAKIPEINQVVMAFYKAEKLER